MGTLPYSICHRGCCCCCVQQLNSPSSISIWDWGPGSGLFLSCLSVCLSTGHKKASVGYRTMIYFDKGVTHKYLSDFFTPFME